MKYINFDSDFTEICSQGSNLQCCSIDSDDGLATSSRQAIILTNGDKFTDAYVNKWWRYGIYTRFALLPLCEWVHQSLNDSVQKRQVMRSFVDYVVVNLNKMLRKKLSYR